MHARVYKCKFRSIELVVKVKHLRLKDCKFKIKKRNYLLHYLLGYTKIIIQKTICVMVLG